MHGASAGRGGRGAVSVRWAAVDGHLACQPLRANMHAPPHIQHTHTHTCAHARAHAPSYVSIYTCTRAHRVGPPAVRHVPGCTPGTCGQAGSTHARTSGSVGEAGGLVACTAQLQRCYTNRKGTPSTYVPMYCTLLMADGSSQDRLAQHTAVRASMKLSRACAVHEAGG
jgi:hypothetical protein